ncbi:MAG: hypothetical protein C0434_15975 [Xanthomonadaceae bacterium]|nr:hypothetical protein [Xanthomonadaceae bacterium]
MNLTMNLQRFAALIDAYGAEPRRWPQAERAEALAFANGDARAAALLRDAAALDALLDADVSAPATATARRALLAALPPPVLRVSRGQELLALLGGWRIALPAMAMALVAGINLGATAGAVVFSTTETASPGADSASTRDEARYSQGFAERLLLDLQQIPQ